MSNLFTSRKFGMVQHLEINIPVSRYFSQRRLNYTQRFSPNGDYVFYAQYSHIFIAMRKMWGNLNASVFANYINLVRNDQGHVRM